MQVTQQKYALGADKRIIGVGSRVRPNYHSFYDGSPIEDPPHAGHIGTVRELYEAGGLLYARVKYLGFEPKNYPAADLRLV